MDNDTQTPNVLDTLKNYIAIQEAIEHHMQANKQVFDILRKLDDAALKARNDLEDAAAEANQGAQHGGYEVVLKPQSQTFIDPAILRIKGVDENVITFATRTVPRPPFIVIRKQSE